MTAFTVTIDIEGPTSRVVHFCVFLLSTPHQMSNGTLQSNYYNLLYPDQIYIISLNNS